MRPVDILKTEATLQGFTIVMSVEGYLVSVDYILITGSADMALPQASVEIALPKADMIFQTVCLILPSLSSTPEQSGLIN